jgi:hypothetical protein
MTEYIHKSHDNGHLNSLFVSVFEHKSENWRAAAPLNELSWDLQMAIVLMHHFPCFEGLKQ